MVARLRKGFEISFRAFAGLGAFVLLLASRQPYPTQKAQAQPSDSVCISLSHSPPNSTSCPSDSPTAPSSSAE